MITPAAGVEWCVSSGPVIFCQPTSRVRNKSYMKRVAHKGYPQLSYQLGGFDIFSSASSFGLVPNELDRSEYHIDIPLSVFCSSQQTPKSAVKFLLARTPCLGQLGLPACCETLC